MQRCAHILLLGLFTVFVEGKVSVGKMNSYIQSLQIVSKTAEELYESLKDEKDVTAPEVIVTFVKTIPVIGEIVNLFTGQTSETSQQLETVKKELKVLSENQDKIVHGIENLQNKIDILPIKNEITTRSVDINSCFRDLNYYLRQPEMKSRQDNIRKCADAIKPGIRFIAELLKESNTYTKVFGEIIETDKLCNVSKIMGMHKYLLSLFVTGCEAAITSEVVEYNGTSTNMLEECNTNFQDINAHLMDIFRGCTNDPCDTVISVLNSSILLNIDKHAKVIWQDVTSYFPWFHFQIYEFSVKPNVTIVGNKKPSSVTFLYNATQQYFVAWTPYKTQINPGNSSLGFSFEIDCGNIVTDFTSMNVTSNLETRPAHVTGFVVDDPYVSSKICINTVREMYAEQKSGTSILSQSGLCVFMVIVVFLVNK